MKHFVLLLFATSTLFYSCQTRRDLLTNYYEDENYFNPALPSPFDAYGVNETNNLPNQGWSNEAYQSIWENDSTYTTGKSPRFWGGMSSNSNPAYAPGYYQGNFGQDNDAAFGFSNSTNPYYSPNALQSPWTFWAFPSSQWLPTGLPWNWYSPVWNMSGGSAMYGYAYPYNYYGAYGYSPYGFSPYSYYGYSPYWYGWGNSTPNGGSTLPAGTTHPNTRRPSKYSGSRGNSSRGGRTTTSIGDDKRKRSAQGWLTPAVLSPTAPAQPSNTVTKSRPQRTPWWESLLDDAATNLSTPSRPSQNATGSGRSTTTTRSSWQSGSNTPQRSTQRGNETQINNSRSNSFSPSSSGTRSGSTPTRSNPTSTSGRRR